MARTTRTKYLNYVEDTKKHHALLSRVVRKSGISAVTRSKSNDVAVTFLDGEKIVRESSNGRSRVVYHLETKQRRVKIGSKIKVHKR